ncbi:MAG: hypothetical protein ACE14T_07405 [Syntrophales bacterium]
MKNAVFVILAVVSVFSINGCFAEALVAVQAVLTAKSVYQGYEDVTSSRKNVQDTTPVFNRYRVAFISVDVQPKKANPEDVNKTIVAVYCRTVNDMARKFGLNTICLAYDEKEVASRSDALVIQVEEIKPNLLGRMISGGKLYASVKYIDKKSAKFLSEEKYELARDYREMVRVAANSAMVKMCVSVGCGQKSSAEIARKRKGLGSEYPIITVKEKEILSEG